MFSLTPKNRQRIESVSDDDYEQRIFHSGRRVFFVAGANWCSQTQYLLDDVLPEFVKTYSHEVLFLYAPIEGKDSGVVLNPKIKVEFKIRRYPTIIAVVDGEFLKRVVVEDIRKQESEVRKILFLFRVTDRE